MIVQKLKQDSSIWLYESVQKMNLTPSEELFYCFLIKKTFYEMKDYCTDVITDKDGRIDWSNINDEYSDTPIVPFWKYQTAKFQQYIEDTLGISRRSMFNILNSLQEKGILSVVYAEDIYNNDLVIELFKDDYRQDYDVNSDKYHGQCYVLNIDYMQLYFDKYRSIYLKQSLLKTPKLLYFYSWMLDHFNYWNKQGKKFMTSAEHLAEEYGVSISTFKKMIVELKALGYISKDYKKEWYIM